LKPRTYFFVINSVRGGDRALLIWMTRLWPSLLGAAQVVQPETI
jgi:hypothetical protein